MRAQEDHDDIERRVYVAYFPGDEDVDATGDWAIGPLT